MSKTWDLVHGEVLFAHQLKSHKRVYLWEEDLAELENVLGPIPRSLLQRSQLPDSTAYSGSKGRLLPVPRYPHTLAYVNDRPGKRMSFSPWKLS